MLIDNLVHQIERLIQGIASLKPGFRNLALDLSGKPCSHSRSSE